MASTFHFCVLQAITWRKYNMHVNRNEWIVDLFLIMFSNFHISDSWIWNYCSRGIGKMETLREDVIQNAIKFLSNPNVKGTSIEQRRSFLRGKGLSNEEVEESFRRIVVSSNPWLKLFQQKFFEILIGLWSKHLLSI